MLHLYNTKTKSKEKFIPIQAGELGLYVCGPTVYDFAHIGNARPIIVFDTLYRLAKQLFGYENVTYVRNITDVDDKINKRALDENCTIQEITARTTAQFHKDISDLGCLSPNHEPRATNHIDDMIALIERLIAKNHAYAAQGHVLFRVKSYKDYGKLSGRSLDDMMAGARVEVAPYKEDPMDFVLWKPSENSDPAWDSPWGSGRPGWHIECSAMSKAFLGEVFDIHGGGIDLTFPHHENEIAQSCCANDTHTMANIWMHNGFVLSEGEKMSKSVGNFYTIRQLLDTHNGETLRLTMLSTHYRQPINWTKASMQSSADILEKWRRKLDGFDLTTSDDLPVDEVITQALCDDLNTPKAITRLHELFKNISSDPTTQNQEKFVGAARQLGLFAPQEEIGDGYFVSKAELNSNSDFAAQVESLIEQRNAARKEKDYAKADSIRDQLGEMGVVMLDSAEGTSWELKS